MEAVIGTIMLPKDAYLLVSEPGSVLPSTVKRTFADVIKGKDLVMGRESWISQVDPV